MRNPFTLTTIKNVLIFFCLLQRTDKLEAISDEMAFIPSALSKWPKKCNGNAPSDLYQDVVLDPQVDAVGRMYPWVLASTERKSNNRFHTKSTEVKYSRWLRKTSHPFFKRGLALLELREKNFSPLMSQLLKQAGDEFEDFISHTSIEKAKQLRQILIEVLQYRFHIELALYASRLNYINCGEQTSLAFVEELIRAKNGDWPLNRPLNLFRISLGINEKCTRHRFLVAGSTTLPKSKLILHDKAEISKIFETMDGEIIDNWNNPKAGGLHQTASKARTSFLLYSPRVSEAFDCMEILEFAAKDIHERIQEMKIEPEFKKILTKYAGATLDEVESILHPGMMNTSQEC